MSIESLDLAGAVPARVARPAGTPRSGVVVLHQAPGWSPQTQDWLERLAADGHLAVAPLLLHHRGEVSIDPGARFGGDMGAFAAFLPGDAELDGDVAAALAFLAESGVDRAHTGLLGFSYGGRAAFRAATEHQVGAAVTFYGTGIVTAGYPGNDGLLGLADRIPELRTPWLGLYGEQDFLLQPGELDALERDVQLAPATTEVVRYPGAGHAFDVDLVFAPGAPSSLVPDAGADATARAEQFLRAHLG